VRRAGKLEFGARGFASRLSLAHPEMWKVWSTKLRTLSSASARAAALG
jgi:hypothetical protein